MRLPKRAEERHERADSRLTFTIGSAFSTALPGRVRELPSGCPLVGSAAEWKPLFGRLLGKLMWPAEGGPDG
jgi:hypothetical protein